MNSADPGTPVLDLERFLPYRLCILADRVTGGIARLYARRFGVTIPEWRVVAVLGRRGAMTAGAIGEQTAMDKVRVSRAVARLAASGRIERRPDGGDRRRAVLDLSPAGRAVYVDIAPLALALEKRLLACFDPGDRAALDRILAKLEAVAATDFADPALPGESDAQGSASSTSG